MSKLFPVKSLRNWDPVHNRPIYLSDEEYQRLRRREIYGRTEPHADLDPFDAYGMDIVEGRL